MSVNTLDSVYGGMSAEDAFRRAVELDMEDWEWVETSLPQGQTEGDSPPSQTGEDSPPSRSGLTRRQRARQRRLLSGVPQKPPGAQQRAAAAEAKQAAAEARRKRVVGTQENLRKPKPSRYIPEGYMCQICRMGKEAENDEKKGVPRKLRCRCSKEVVWHFGCINTWLRATEKCPLCRAPVRPFHQS